MTQASVVFLFAAMSTLPQARADDELSKSAQLETSCLVCHGNSATMQSRVAPPMVAVKEHYLTTYPERADFVRAVSNWLLEPSAERTQMPGAIRRFGLMPPVDLDAETMLAIAELIHDTDMRSPDWYEEHRQAEHGPRKAAKGDAGQPKATRK